MGTIFFTLMRALGLAILVGGALTSCAVKNVAMRDVPRVAADSEKIAPASTGHLGNNLKRSSYIESTAGPRFSCSFVEFDERGDFLDFRQHQHCWLTIRKLAKRSRVLLVMYCHGWKNNSQSGDVVEFNRFLGRLAESEPIIRGGLRVHGVFLSWKGGIFKTGPTRKSARSWSDRYFEPDIVDPSEQNPLKTLTWLPEQLTYWNRKRAAEDRVSGVPFSRAVFTYASVADKSGTAKKENIVVLMGHSFGALMVEQSVAEASVGALVTGWPWFQPGKQQSLRQSLPFDLVLLINSAAPSLYSKMLRDLADAHDSALDRKTPLIVSLTSKSDSATRILHPIANLGAPLDPSMAGRSYEYQMLAKQERSPSGKLVTKRPKIAPPVRQNEFYRRTPGHNKYLVSHRIEPIPAVAAERPSGQWDEIFRRNIMEPTSDRRFVTANENGSKRQGWMIRALGNEIPHGSNRYAPLDTAYWIIRCDKDLIDGHNDIWNDRAMHAYGAIFGITKALR